jgi:hypothetical protein
MPAYSSTEENRTLSNLNQEALKYFRSNDIEAAINVWSEAANIVAQNGIKSSLAAEVLNNLGYAHYKEFNFNKSEKYLLESKSINDSRWALYLNLGDLYEKKGECSKANDAYTSLLKLNPNYKNKKKIINKLKSNLYVCSLVKQRVDIERNRSSMEKKTINRLFDTNEYYYSYEDVCRDKGFNLTIYVGSDGTRMVDVESFSKQEYNVKENYKYFLNTDGDIFYISRFYTVYIPNEEKINRNNQYMGFYIDYNNKIFNKTEREHIRSDAALVKFPAFDIASIPEGLDAILSKWAPEVQEEVSNSKEERACVVGIYCTAIHDHDLKFFENNTGRLFGPTPKEDLRGYLFSLDNVSPSTYNLVGTINSKKVYTLGDSGRVILMETNKDIYKPIYIQSIHVLGEPSAEPVKIVKNEEITLLRITENDGRYDHFLYLHFDKNGIPRQFEPDNLIDTISVNLPATSYKTYGYYNWDNFTYEGGWWDKELHWKPSNGSIVGSFEIKFSVKDGSFVPLETNYGFYDFIVDYTKIITDPLNLLGKSISSKNIPLPTEAFKEDFNTYFREIKDELVQGFKEHKYERMRFKADAKKEAKSFNVFNIPIIRLEIHGSRKIGESSFVAHSDWLYFTKKDGDWWMLVDGGRINGSEHNKYSDDFKEMIFLSFNNRTIEVSKLRK